MRPGPVTPFTLAAIAFGLVACAQTPLQKAALDPTALYEEQVEEGFGRLDVLPSKWSVMPQDRAAQPLNTSRILAARPE